MYAATHEATHVPKWLQSSWLGPLESSPRFRAWREKIRAYPPPALDGSTLNRLEQALVAAVADALFPPGGLFPLSGTEAGMIEYFDGYLRRCHGQEGLLLRLLLLATELSPFVFGPRRAPFSKLSLADRTRSLQEAFKSRIYFRRVAFTSMRALMTMGYLSNRQVAEHMGFAPNADPFGLGDSKEVSS